MSAQTHPNERSAQSAPGAAAPLRVILHGPHPSAGGGVVAFCAALERALTGNDGPVRVTRWHIGTAKGDDVTAGGAVAGLMALASSLPQLWRLAGKGRTLHLNTSFTKKALWRDAVYFRLARLRGANVVTQFHGGSPSVNGDRLSRAAVRTLTGADAIVVINETQRDELLALDPTLAAKTQVIANGVHLPAFDRDALTRDRLEHPRLLFLSRLAPGKGLPECIKALRHLHDAGLPLELDVAGDGPELEGVQALARELGLEGAVRFHGLVSGEAKDELFKRASLLLFPSRLPEGQPMVILEAFAWGLPVVSSNAGALATLVPDGVSGLQVSPDDPEMLAAAVTQLLRDKASYEAMAAGNRVRAEQEFDAKRTGERFARLYRQVARTGR